MKKLSIVSGLMVLGLSASLIGCGSVTQSTAEVIPAVVEVAEEQTALASFENAAGSGISADAKTPADSLTYMGGLYISDPENDLMMAIYRSTDGGLKVLITKLGETIYGDLRTELATLEDGREYTKLTTDGRVFGYHFCVGDDDPTDSILVDEDGTVYPAKDIDESVAEDMLVEAFGK